jgi:archaellin
MNKFNVIIVSLFALIVIGMGVFIHQKSTQTNTPVYIRN